MQKYTMAKFIELPYGGYNQESQSFERKMMLVNMERIIKIAPDGETTCRVTLAGGNQVVVSRRYDTLSSQITHQDNLLQVYPDEEVAAAYDAGYEKAKKELKPNESKKKQIKQLCALAAEWFESNPVSAGWQSRFRRDIKEKLEIEETEVVE